MKKSSGKLAVVVACALIALASAAYGEASSKSDVPTPTGVESNGPAPLAVGDSAADLVYTPVAPCRIIDTRGAGGGPLAANTTRNFRVTGAATMASQGGSTTGCGVPSGATAAIINFVAVSPAGAGDLQAWPYSPSGVAPNASIINYAALPNLNIANAVSIKLCDPAAPPAGGCTSDFTIQADASAVEIVADVQGYFATLPATPGVPGYQIVTGATVSGPAGVQSTATATCPAGKALLGGGAFGSSSSVDQDVNSSYPESTTVWRVYMNNGTAGAITFRAYAICGTVT